MVESTVDQCIFSMNFAQAALAVGPRRKVAMSIFASVTALFCRVGAAQIKLSSALRELAVSLFQLF